MRTSTASPTPMDAGNGTPPPATRGSKTKVQPRTSPSCDRCSAKKVRCEDVPGHDSCQRCLENDVRCERSTTDGSSGRVQCKRACGQCRGGKMRCTPDPSLATPACVRCLEKGMGEECTFVLDAQASASATDNDNDNDDIQHADSGGLLEGGGRSTSDLRCPSQFAHRVLPKANSPSSAPLVMDSEPLDTMSAPSSPSRNYWDVVV